MELMGVKWSEWDNNGFVAATIVMAGNTLHSLYLSSDPEE